ncbi:MAG: RNA 2'-phosphotransferase [Planctomycetota bacterium]
MNTASLKQVSKSLSYVLRHRPDAIGIALDANGWVGVDELLAAFARDGKAYTRPLIDRVVAENDKQRFEFSDDGLRIRARQGHSVDVDLAYKPAVPPDVLYHGTATRNLASILEHGLLKAKRHHVHLSTDKATMLAVAMRHGKPVMLVIDAKRMHDDGHAFFVTGNRVWLTDHVPPVYLEQTDCGTA